jgi:hypothetical protein
MGSGRSNKNRLRVRRVVDVPLREVSGICLSRGRNGRMYLIAVGDRVTKVAWFSQPVTSICSVTSPPRLRGSKISGRAAAPLHSLMRGGSAIWMASRKVSHSPHRGVRSSGSTRASRAEILSC